MTSPSVRFETLIERHHDEIYRYLWRMLASTGKTDTTLDAQDLTQEVFLRAYPSFERLRPDSNYRAWLYKIATNCAYTALKRSQRNRALTFEDVQQLPAGADQSPHHQAVLSEMRATIRRAIATLPPKQGAALVMRHVQGLDYAEIAQVLDCSLDSARANVYQAIRRLRRELGPEAAQLLAK